jgi:hypothetical protein
MEDTENAYTVLEGDLLESGHTKDLGDRRMILKRLLEKLVLGK